MNVTQLRKLSKFCHILTSTRKQNTLKKREDFNLCGACYPEGHADSEDKVKDILNLKNKTDAGVTHLMSQLFFDNDAYYSFVENCRIAGINVPIHAGIMPVVNKAQIERMVKLCGASLPEKFKKILDKYADNKEALFDAGMVYAVNQIVELLASGVDGIHIYTMNNPVVAKRICDEIRNLIYGKHRIDRYCCASTLKLQLWKGCQGSI